jgi:hypothetical protein
MAPYILTMTCFGIWAVCTAAVIAIAAIRPDIARWGEGRRMKASNFFDVLMLTGIGAWLAMWCFRSMY